MAATKYVAPEPLNWLVQPRNWIVNVILINLNSHVLLVAAGLDSTEGLGAAFAQGPFLWQEGPDFMCQF